MKNALTMAVVASASLFAGACSTSSGGMDTGERITQRAGEIGNYGEAWSDGQKGVREGEKLVKNSSSKLANAEEDLVRARERAARAERQIGEARADQAKGAQQIQDGTAQMQRAEGGYTALRTGPSAVAPEN